MVTRNSFLALSLLVTLTGCKTASVTCTHIERLESGLGFLNLPNEVVGNIIEIVPASKTGGFKEKLITRDGDVSITPGDSETDISQSSDLDIELSADIPSTAQAALKTQISNNLILKLTNSQRHQIDQPEVVLNRAENQDTIKGFFAHAPTGHRFLLVFGGNSAESVDFSVKHANDNTVTVNVPGTGNFSVKVNFDCQGELTKKIEPIKANHMVAFFKVVEIFENSDNTISTRPFEENLGEYNLNFALK